MPPTENTANSSLMNKVSWFAKSFGRTVDCILYSNGDVCMTWGISCFKSKKGRTFRYPVVNVRDATEDDYEDTHLFVRFIVCGKTVDFFTYYFRSEKLWSVDSISVDNEDNDELIAEMKYQHGLEFVNLENLVNSIKQTAEWFETEVKRRISAESFRKNEPEM